MKFKCFYNIARVLAQYVPLRRNEKNPYLRTGVNIFFYLAAKLPSFLAALQFPFSLKYGRNQQTTAEFFCRH